MARSAANNSPKVAAISPESSPDQLVLRGESIRRIDEPNSPVTAK